MIGTRLYASRRGLLGSSEVSITNNEMLQEGASRVIALSRFARLTAGMTFLLLIAGGLVTSTDSGLAVPDWPLSYGTLFPPMVGGIRFEHSHRVIAGIVAILIWTLAVWLHRRESRGWVRGLGYAAAAAVLAQALLGGLTVLLLLPPAVSVAHACLGQTVLCLVASIALATSRAWQDAGQPASADPSLRRLAGSTTAAIFLQLILGAIIRHAGIGLAAHVAGAAAVLVLVLTLAWRSAHSAAHAPFLDAVRRVMRVGVVAQALLGVGVLASRQHPLVTTAHVGLGALLLASSWLATLWLWRPELIELSSASIGSATPALSR